MKLFEIRKIEFGKKFYLFGLKIFQTKKHPSEFLIKKLQCYKQDIAQEVRNQLSIMNLHSKTFPKYKGINKGKSVAIIGTGPSLNEYIPVEGAINIGLNRAFMYDKIRLDYLFMIDYNGVKDYIKDAQDYECKKFYGLYAKAMIDPRWNIPNYIAEDADAERFYSNCISDSIDYDIETAPLADFASVAFPALHFALYTHPEKIYLVGCDTAQIGQFNNTKQGNMNVEKVLEGYQKFKEFAQIYYPDVEIISINPVGTKTIFKDYYQKGEN